MQQKLNGKGKRVKGNLSLLIHRYIYLTVLYLMRWLNELGSCRGPGWLNELGSCRGPRWLNELGSWIT